MIEDQKFLADLDKNCAQKKEEYAARVATRNEELLALADTIKILNDDDALEIFKKTALARECPGFCSWPSSGCEKNVFCVTKCRISMMKINKTVESLKLSISLRAN